MNSPVREEKRMLSRIDSKRLAVLLMVSVLMPVCSRAQSPKSPVAPRREQVQAVVQEAYDKFKSDSNGKNADYIPYLAQVPSNLFGIAIVTTDNQVLSLGDVKYS